MWDEQVPVGLVCAAGLELPAPWRLLGLADGVWVPSLHPRENPAGSKVVWVCVNGIVPEAALCCETERAAEKPISKLISLSSRSRSLQAARSGAALTPLQPQSCFAPHPWELPWTLLMCQPWDTRWNIAAPGIDGEKRQVRALQPLHGSAWYRLRLLLGITTLTQPGVYGKSLAD